MFYQFYALKNKLDQVKNTELQLFQKQIGDMVKLD